MNGLDAYQVQRRAGTARAILIAVFILLVTAFFRVQIIQHEKFQLRAETNRLRPVPLTAPRGTIFDHKGEIIAENVPGYSVKLIAPSADSLRAVLARLATVVPFDSGGTAEVLARYRQARYQPVQVFGDADFATVSRLEEHRALIPGMVIQSEPKRLYPAGKAVAHVVGYVGEVTEAELEKNRFRGASLGTIVGRAGLERQYDDTLRGREGVRYIEVNARGRLVRDEASAVSLSPVAGQGIHTTIDLDLQRFIDSIWPAGVRGAMVAVTPRGEVRALYSAPSYDPNLFVGGVDPRAYRALVTDSAKPLLNRAIYGRYPPASPFKLATAAMALRRGLAGFETRMPVACRGGLQMGNRYFRCWKKEGHGSLDLVGAIAASCDVYFYQLGVRVGIDSMLADGVEMGFSGESHIDLPSEQASFYPASAAYFDKRYGPRGWTRGAWAFNFSIGQGENTQTLINMVQFYQALAGNGVEMPPYVVRRPDSATAHDLKLSQAQLAGLRRALIAVVERGTAAASRRRDMAVAGKTGTAQNSHGKDHGWFVGFAPAEEPEIVIGAIMEFAEHGSTVAPYVVRAMSRYVLGPEAAPPPRSAVVVQRDSAPPPPVELQSDSTLRQPPEAP